tara:strand:+ start:1232 stop:1669 length:438 start_codon:yes stop_codon:yes gene_type:complete
MVARRGLQVLTGSGTNVHRFLDDGSAIIAAGGSKRSFVVSGSTRLGRQTNNVNDLTKVNGVFRIPVYNSGSDNDIGVLNTLAASPEDYNGYVVYLNSNGLKKGMTANGGSTVVADTTAQTFSQGHKWYFARNGAWVPDMFTSFGG